MKKTTRTLTTVEARDDFGNTLNEVKHGEHRIILTRRGEPIAVLVPLSDLQILEDLSKPMNGQSIVK